MGMEKLMRNGSLELAVLQKAGEQLCYGNISCASCWVVKPRS